MKNCDEKDVLEVDNILQHAKLSMLSAYMTDDCSPGVPCTSHHVVARLHALTGGGASADDVHGGGMER